MKIMSKRVKIFGKQISAVALALLAMAGLASAGLLSYYGMLVGTATVAQSVKVDGHDWDVLIEYTIGESPIVAGSSDIEGPHYLTNDAEVPATVKLVTSYTPDGDGITTMYWGQVEYGDSVTTTTSIPATVTVEDLGDSIKWTIDMDEVGGPFGNGHGAVGLVIGIGDNIVYQIHSNDGTDSSYPWGTWLLSYWGPAGTGWHGWHTSDSNTPISEVEDIDATGDRYLVAGKYDGDMPWGPVYHEGNPDLIFTITISKELLHPGEFKWAMALMGDTSDTYTPNTFSWSDEDTSNFHTATLGAEIPEGEPFTLQSSEALSFYITNDFAINLVPDTYTIETSVVPAQNYQ